VGDFVVDASVAVAWCYPDEKSDFTDSVLQDLVRGDGAVAPRLWIYEMQNCVLMGVRRKRIELDLAEEFLTSLERLPVQIHVPAAPITLFRAGHRYGITAYDAAYLTLAQHLSLPLATQDKRLAAAATEAGVPLYVPRPAKDG